MNEPSEAGRRGPARLANGLPPAQATWAYFVDIDGTLVAAVGS